MDIGIGQPVQQGGFSRVGVAHQRQQRPAMAPAPAAQFRTALTDDLELRLDAGDALFDAPPIELKLLFAGALQADTALLALEVSPQAAQAWNQIAQLSQFDLQAAFQR